MKRAKFWDYNRDGTYFVTLVMSNRHNFFGRVFKKEVELSAAGRIVNQVWKEMEEQYRFVRLDEFVVMPDHFHAILKLELTKLCYFMVENRVLEKNGGVTGEKNPMLYFGLSTVIRWFKGRTTYELRKLYSNFKWLKGYHDRIVRDERALKTIRRYIRNNPRKWKKGT